MKTWFITGTSRGFGREWTEAALKRGDKVAATARNIETLNPLVTEFGENILPLELDVTNRVKDFAVIEEAFNHFGEIDVVVNNAGYGLFGVVEEVSEPEARSQMETNFFGALWITQAALPYLRKQGHGHIIQVSSIGGVAAFGGLGLYHASKWALEGMSEALSKEISGFGIKVTLVEPGGFTTDWAGSSAVHTTPIQVYDDLRNKRPTSAKRGDPQATSEAILKLVDSKEPPLRLLLGNFAADHVKELYKNKLETWALWEDISRAADGK